LLYSVKVLIITVVFHSDPLLGILKYNASNTDIIPVLSKMFQPAHFIITSISHRNVLLYCVILYSLTQLIKYGISISHIPYLSNERYLWMMNWMMFKTC